MTLQRSILYTLGFAGSLYFTSCQSTPQQEESTAMTVETETNQKTQAKDVHSYARPEEAVIKHLDLDVDVNFDQKKLTGSATYQIENKTSTDKLILDARDLKIKNVYLDGDKSKPTTFKLGVEKQDFMGQPLEIAIKPETKSVTIEYETTPEAAALQWLNPQQTAGKKYPFLFTQSQAILARTWIPIKDSPGIRFTYNAKVKVPKELLAVMSAENPQQKNSSGVYEFKMTQPIPSYLMALSVGDLVFKPLGNQTGVYAEPATIAEAAYEFAELDKMLVAAEKLYGKYRWDRYDLLVLPPSFPFGGMENPRLTFVT
ncbi:MAG: aminopeptidase, partial [Hymenobacteraceae bacterium]|nr:aminopeptidase [Hymenobacteraceae bacterium]MDX5395139.1 aminopeptidase [Hymenobacteraceae bacterium]MDX5511180.1 aminopeptidase [Hymenobacteraceae bacterium]